MKRFISIVLLALLALPYARAEICSAAGHEHAGDEHHHPAAHATATAASDHGADPSDCHRLMACDTTIQVVLAATTPSPRLEPHVATEKSRTPALLDEPAKAPIPPPPQSV